MSMNIKNEEAHRLARELAAETGETLTAAVTEALRERLAAIRRAGGGAGAWDAIAEIQAFVASLPDVDRRTPEETLYDDDGLPV